MPLKLTLAQFQEASTLLVEVLQFAAPADALLSAHLRKNPKLGSQDRAQIADCVYGVLRRLLALRWLMPEATPRLLLLLWLARFQGISLRELAPFAREKERLKLAEAKAKSLDDAPLSVQAELPEWVVASLRDSQSDEAILALGRALMQPAPLDLRVNIQKANREAVLAKLHEAGIAAEPTPFSPWGIRIAHPFDLSRHPLFKEGFIEVQDEGSQLLALLTGARRGEMVADLCAGAGGKTLALGAAMASTGRLYAFDINEKRLSKLSPRLKRSGLSNVTAQVIAHENDTRLKRLAGKLDRVLIDAPCSGLGTLRRNPDLKFRQSPETVASLTKTQASLIRAGAKLVKAGGRLVYATCSLLPAENQIIVESFLGEHPEFKRLPANGVLAAGRVDLDTGVYLQMNPAVHGTDGFFAAILEKQSPT
ncbi:MAG: RsmB/NOP family class I SAM-dependent RNA methyltransferase [Pseudomonadota bacterium]